MENKLNELETRKAEIEQAFAERQQYLQAMDKDIALMEMLVNAKTERAKVTNELQGYRNEYSKLCEEIATIKSEKENFKKEK